MENPDSNNQFNSTENSLKETSQNRDNRFTLGKLQVNEMHSQHYDIMQAHESNLIQNGDGSFKLNNNRVGVNNKAVSFDRCSG